MISKKDGISSDQEDPKFSLSSLLFLVEKCQGIFQTLSDLFVIAMPYFVVNYILVTTMNYSESKNSVQ